MTSQSAARSASHFLLSLRTWAAALLLGVSAVVAGCGGGGGGGPSTPTLSSIEITPATPSIGLGSTQQLTATGIFSDGSKQTVTTTVTWSSGTATVATVGASSGLATAVAVGTSVITATQGSVTSNITLTVTPATLVSIAVTPPNATLAQGVTEALTATGTYSDNTTQNITGMVTWSSSSATVAAVSSPSAGQEIATALSSGSATLTATLGAISGSTGVTVNSATLVSIGLTPANPSVAKGTHVTFVATGTYSDMTTQVLTTSATWTSGTPATATISNTAGTQGVASTLGVGTTSITAKVGAITSTPVTLTVTPAALVSIAVTPAAPSLAKGTTLQLVATGTYTDNTTQVLTTEATWASATPATATVSNATGSEGLASAAAIGTTSVTAALGGITSPAITLTVTPAVLVSIAVTAPTLSIAKGLTDQFVATGTYSDMTTQVLTTTATWTSGTAATATISNAAGTKGLASSVAVGTTAITATLGTIVSQPVTLIVTPATLVSIAVTAPVTTIPNGTTDQFVATGTYSDNTTQVITNSVTWTSGTPATAAISNSSPFGLATALAVGTTSITATDPTTMVVSPAVTLTVGNTERVYVANYTDGTVSAYKVGAGGALTSLGAAIASGSETFALAADPSGHYLYAANFGPNSSSIAPFLINADGTLSTNGAPVLSGSGQYADPNGLTVHSTNGVAYLYAANFGDGSVSQFAIGAGGVLGAPVTTYITGASSANVGSSEIRFNAAGTFAYVPNYTSATLSVFSVDQTSGALTLVSADTVTLTAGTEPNDIAIVNGNAYVSGQGSPTIAQFTVNADGSLTQVTGLAAGNGGNRSITVGVAGAYLYVPNYQTDVVPQYSFGTTGAPVLANTLTLAADTGPDFLVIDTSGQYAYMSDRGATTALGTTVSQYTIGAGGVLTPMGMPTVPSGTQPAGIITVTGY